MVDDVVSDLVICRDLAARAGGQQTTNGKQKKKKALGNRRGDLLFAHGTSSQGTKKNS
jgi:hypothetical protein